MKSNPLRNMATVAVLRWWHDFSAPRQRRQNSKVGRHSKMEGHTKAIRTLLVTLGVAAIYPPSANWWAADPSPKGKGEQNEQTRTRSGSHGLDGPHGLAKL